MALAAVLQKLAFTASGVTSAAANLKSDFGVRALLGADAGARGLLAGVPASNAESST